MKNKTQHEGRLTQQGDQKGAEADGQGLVALRHTSVRRQKRKGFHDDKFCYK